MTNQMPSTESIALYYKEGSSDKVYQAQLEQSLDGWVVNFQYGRRDSALTAGTKTKEPVDYKVAKKAYDKVVAEKVGKGYSVDPQGKTFQSLPEGKMHSGLSAQLSNEVDDAEAQLLIQDDNWIAQEKYDGRRRMIRKLGSVVEGTNREGILIAMSSETADAVSSVFKDDLILDGEDLGTHLVVFDILEHNGKDLRGVGCLERWKYLVNLVGGQPGFIEGSKVFIADTAVGTQAKEVLATTVRTAEREGLVFKKADSPYVAGRPASAGSHRKWKFYEQATCRVKSRHATKSSVGFELMNAAGEWIGCGNVKIPTNHNTPPLLAIIEVKYLYAHEGGSLVQPSYQGQRDDVTELACVMAQLKFKPKSAFTEDD